MITEATAAGFSASTAPSLEEQARNRARRRVFALTAAISLAVGVVYTLLQPVVYQSKAVVLMTAPAAIDAEIADADVQEVAIQRRVLTGNEITGALTEQLQQNYGSNLDAIGVRALLDVESVPDTNLLELQATGSEAELLPPLVETWIDVYTNARAEDIEQRRSQTMTEVQSELDGLAEKLVEARTALDVFRAENEIISMERQENAVLSELEGLNKALNNAIEAEVKAKAYLDTLRESLAAGEQFVPQSERKDVAGMAERLAQLRSRLVELRSRYTDDYIQKDPRLREIPLQVEELAAELQLAYSEGTSAELANAERDFRSASESVRELRARLEEHKDDVASFNSMYATHEALVEDLARLEALNRDSQARLVQIEVSQIDRYPQLSVVDWPATSATRIGPHYSLLLGATLGIATALSLFAVWLYGYLNPRPQQPAFVALSGVPVYPNEAIAAIDGTTRPQQLESQNNARLAHQEAGIDDSSSPDEEDLSGEPVSGDANAEGQNGPAVDDDGGTNRSK
ncbi:MAG: hypothetical protein AAGI88_23090 [Pseudomonadota bacterium]